MHTQTHTHTYTYTYTHTLIQGISILHELPPLVVSSFPIGSVGYCSVLSLHALNPYFSHHLPVCVCVCRFVQTLLWWDYRLVYERNCRVGCERFRFAPRFELGFYILYLYNVRQVSG